MDVTQWEKLNPPRRGSVDETNQAWERELKDDERMRDATAKSRPVASSPSPSSWLANRRRGTDPGRDGRPGRARRAAARARQARDVFERRAIGHDSRDDSRSAEDVAGRPSLLHWLFDIHLHVRRLGLRGSRSISGRACRRRL